MTQRIFATVVAQLREKIQAGELAPGQRIAEEAICELLGVSRTPVRLAFKTLAQEGLLHVAGKRGYSVRAFSATDVLCGVEVRGVLEGLAARRLAERGLDPLTDAALQTCLDQGEATLAAGELNAEAMECWATMNARFHALIVNGAGSSAVADAIARNNHLPFASADSITLQTSAMEREYRKLVVAQLQHRVVVDALRARESARAEMLMREHAYIGLRYEGVVGAGPSSVRMASSGTS
jgi:GntR family transcriptional regulator, vanillate catabolism transcriptional regulator